MDKQNIINNFSKNEFMDFLKYDKTKEIFKLLDNEGINILKNSPLKNDRIGYILAFSPYKNELLQNISFLDVLLNSNISSFYSVLSDLSYKAYDTILRRSIELNLPSIANIFYYFNTEYKLNKIDNWNYSNELLYEILKNDEPCIIKKIIDNFDIDLTSHDINLRNFFNKSKISILKGQEQKNIENKNIRVLEIPPTMITKEVAQKLWNDYDIFGVRAIINDAQYSTDTSLLNDYVKSKEDYIIKNFNSDLFLSPYQELYDTFIKFKLEELKVYNETIDNDENYYICRRNFLNLINKLNKTNYYHDFNNLYNQNGLEAVKEYLKKLNDNYLSNYIIDYHFEENYHNIMLDMRELLNFYYNGYISIPMERLELYDKISNIDYLSSEEKLELHKLLKNFNMIEIFYDDMAFARHIVAESIKEYSLSSQTIKQYKDEKLSKTYGVDVYNFDGSEFFGIVKTNRHETDTLPTGHSYSLIGDGGIAVFGDPKDSNTYLYDSDDMNPEQLIHAFPFDSFTYYHPLETSSKPSTRVNMLAMPDELVETSSSYNELLILEKGKNKTDIDKYIPELKRIALYCLDEIREQDLEVAKANGIGIMLINSSKYKSKNNSHLYTYHNSLESYNNDYFDGFYEKDKYEAKR